MVDYRLSGGARDDILGIFFVGLELFGYQQAEAYRNSLERAFDLLAQFPEMARLREEISGGIRASRHKAHVIVYELDESNHVFILRIRHAHEDWLSDPL